MAKIGKFSGVSVPSTKGGAIKGGKTGATVSPQQKNVSFTGQKVDQQKQVQRKEVSQRRPDKGQQRVQDRGKGPQQLGNYRVSAGKGGTNVHLTNISRNISFGRVSDQQIGAHLAKLNLPVNQENMDMAKVLLSFKMPLTTENLKDLTTALAMMSQKTPGDAQAGVFMKLKSMNINPKNAKALQTLFAKNPALGKQFDQLQRMAKYFSTMGKAMISDSALTSLMSHVASLFGEMIAQPGREEKKMSKKLQDLAEEVGIEGESGKSKKSGKNSARGNLSKLKKKFNDRISTLKDYVNKDQEEILEETAGLLEQLDENLEAQRLINCAPSVDDDSFVYLQVPLRMANNKISTAHLKLDYEYDMNGQKIVNPRKTRIEFSIDTEKMGIINIVMNLWKRRIGFYLEAEEAEVKNHINTYAPDLIKVFKDKAYKVGSWDCVVKDEPVTFPNNLLEQEEEISELITLDATI